MAVIVGSGGAVGGRNAGAPAAPVAEVHRIVGEVTADLVPLHPGATREQVHRTVYEVVAELVGGAGVPERLAVLAHRRADARLHASGGHFTAIRTSYGRSLPPA